MDDKNSPPPDTLIQTWITLATCKKSSKEVKTRALNMLRECIGTPEDINTYIKKHSIKIR